MEHNEHDANLALAASRRDAAETSGDPDAIADAEIALIDAHRAIYDRAIRAAREKARQSW